MKPRKQKLVALLLLVLAPLMAFATEVKPVKNVIVMISDGTSLSALSLARWYQRAINEEAQNLHLDPYLSGTILTYCSNAPIGDSAPTTSTYMNGVPSIQGFVGTYPYSNGDADLIPLDPSMEYRPIVSLMEATKILQGKKSGLVATAEFPHATPADCTAHSYKRGKYDWIIPQMVHNGVDVVMAGGTSLLTAEQQQYLHSQGYGVFLNDISSLNYQGEKMWSLFGDVDISYDLDHQPGVEPTIDQMTETAIRLLDNENGFILMVEGSKVDWAAHANDPVGIATDFLAFDRAFKVALDFAKRDGNTAIIVTSDHGNSGLSIGTTKTKNYAGTSLKDLLGPLTSIKKTADGLAKIVLDTPEEELATLFTEQTSITLTDPELKALVLARRHDLLPKEKEEERKEIRDEIDELDLEGIKLGSLYSGALSTLVGSLYRHYLPHIGFTTFGHTGEEVFLATYAPTPEQRLMGFNTNIELHHYLRSLLGIEQTMLELSHNWFAPHTQVFAGMNVTIKGEKPEEKVLTIKHKGNTLQVQAFSSQATLNGKSHKLHLAPVYVDKKDTFYLPTHLADLLRK